MASPKQSARTSRVVIFLWSLLVLFLLTPVVVMLSLGSPPEPVPTNTREQPTGQATPQAAPVERPATAAPPPAGPPATASAPTSGAELLATRTTASPSDSGEPLAEQITACLLVVDHESGAPVAGAAVRRVQGGTEIAFSDERGLAPVPLAKAEQLAVVADGYLLRMAPTQPGSSEAAPQRVQLVADRWSMLRRFAFTPKFGEANPEYVFTRFRPLTPPSAAAERHGPSPQDTVAARAWQEHGLLAALPVGADAGVQLGMLHQDHVHRLLEGDSVRFAVPGEYEAEAATASGLAGRARFAVAAGSAAATVTIALAKGAFVGGVVRSGGGGPPVAGAELRVQGGDPLGLLARTGADGAFRLGPLAAAELSLLVRHGEHKATAFGPVRSSAAALEIALEPLPLTALRGRVLSRADGQPLAGVHVAWLPTGADPVTATSDREGLFAVAATGSQAARLNLSMPGYLSYTELLEPGAPFAEFSLWPATMEERLRAGLSARLTGVVLDANGLPAPGVGVRWVPNRPQPLRLQPGRRILEGASPPFTAVVPTGLDGAFDFETDQFGPGRLCFAEDGPGATTGLATEATAGATTQGLQLQR